MPTWRITTFRLGVATVAVEIPALLLSLTSPFALVADSHRSFSDTANLAAKTIALGIPLLTFVLTVFGHGWQRVVLLLLSVGLFALAYLGLLMGGH